VTGFPARIPVVDCTQVFHVPEPVEVRIQNGRKPGGAGSVTACVRFESVSGHLRAVSARISLAVGRPESLDDVIGSRRIIQSGPSK
jgi:hypothetical protein